jgi:hypothetical protein
MIVLEFQINCPKLEWVLLGINFSHRKLVRSYASLLWIYSFIYFHKRMDVCNILSNKLTICQLKHHIHLIGINALFEHNG